MTVNVKQQVLQFMLDNFTMGGGKEITDHTSFIDQHIIDSTGFLELISFVEQTFGIQVLDEEMIPENLDSLSSIERYVLNKLAAVPAAAG